ncbi:MAG TPA: thioesterase family protein [Gemmatimonadales bacterium]|nr:thioesterase family protein [Gemmatimonadales bacterium]
MPVSHVDILQRVNYSEIDQMGVVYHSRYAVWLDVARTEYLRRAGMSYRELEGMGFFLVVGDLTMRYHRPARYDDEVRVRCWVSDLASRRVTFGYRLTHAESGALLVTAETRMLSLNHQFEPTRLPPSVSALLHVVPEPA